MAQIAVITPRGEGSKRVWIVSQGKPGTVGYKETDCGSGMQGAEKAAELAAEINAKIAAEESKPLTVSVSNRKQLTVRPNDREQYGAYPVLTVTGNQFELLNAHWAEIVEYFTAHKSEIANHWQDMPPAQKRAKA